jgi:hypothetical protein
MIVIGGILDNGKINICMVKDTYTINVNKCLSMAFFYKIKFLKTNVELFFKVVLTMLDLLTSFINLMDMVKWSLMMALNMLVSFCQEFHIKTHSKIKMKITVQEVPKM